MIEERDLAGVRTVAQRYGWSVMEAALILTDFFENHRPRIEAGMITHAEMLAIFREHHMRPEER